MATKVDKSASRAAARPTKDRDTGPSLAAAPNSPTQHRKTIPQKQYRKAPTQKQQTYFKARAQGSTPMEAVRAAGYAEGVRPCDIDKQPGVQQLRERFHERYPNLVDKIVDTVVAGMDAVDTKTATFEGTITDKLDLVAWSERRSAAELAAKMGGLYTERDNSDDKGPPINLTVELEFVDPAAKARDA